MRRISQDQVALIASRARALGEPARVRMVEVLSRGEQAVGELAETLDMQQSTASKHLQVLFHAGFVARRRNASAVIYSLNDESLLDWLQYLGHRQIGTRRRSA